MRPLALAVLLVSSGAAARQVVSNFDAAVSSQVTAVHGELTGTIATFRVSYTLALQESGYGITVDTLEIPTTALVTAASVRQNGSKRQLHLIGSEQASTRWAALAGDDKEELAKQPPGSRRSAMMIAGGPGSVTVSIAAPRTGRAELELELAMQTCFFRDARHVLVPATWA
ncbi:MAG: hypothetical protein H0T42_18220, partial [Deltaproteobacteria bacterium]|nr:hypothetical protein [Deltaproteobacteria bacterium]